MSDIAALDFQVRVLTSDVDKLRSENAFLRDEVVHLLREKRTAKLYANRLRAQLKKLGATPEEESP